MLQAPSIRAIPFDRVWPSSMTTELLTEPQRQHLASISSVRHLQRRGILFAADTVADSVFIVSHGVMKSFRELPSGRRRVVAFLFPSDVMGLAEQGRYVNTAQALTAATVYCIPLDVLKESFRRDVSLQFQFLCKVTHELREAQRQTLAVGRRDAPGKLAMFLETLRRNRSLREGNGSHGAIEIPMSRTDIANYLGLSHEAVSRAAGRLARLGLVAFPDRHHVEILDPTRLHRLATAL